MKKSLAELIKEAIDPTVRLPRPDDSNVLYRNDNQFAGPLPPEDIAHNRQVLQQKADMRKANNLPPNPFLGRVLGVQMQDSNGRTMVHKPTKLTADQNEVIDTMKSQIDLSPQPSTELPDNGFKTVPLPGGGSQLIGADGKVHGVMTPSKPSTTSSAPTPSPTPAAAPSVPQKSTDTSKPVLSGGTDLSKAGSLRRRNTGIVENGEVWINPADYSYLEKSAMYRGVTPEQYRELPAATEVESLENFFFPQ